MSVQDKSSTEVEHVSDDDLNQAIECIKVIKQKSHNPALSGHVGKINRYAKRNGLDGETIVTLTDLACSGRYSDTVSNRLVFSLIPRDKVPVKAVIKAVSWMCSNTPSNSRQVHILRWLVIVQSLVDDQERLHGLYGIIFYFIESERLCPHVCHLLYLITRKADVRLFNVRRLVTLQIKMGLPIFITGLLSLYKLYSPHLVSMTMARRTVYFKEGPADRSLRADIHSVQTHHSTAHRVIDTGTHQSDTGTQLATVMKLNITRELSDKPKPRKRRKLDCVPKPSTSVHVSDGSQQLTVCSLDRDRRVQVEEMKTFKDLLTHIDRVEMPGQIASVLHSDLLYHAMSVTPDKVTRTRFIYWLSTALDIEICDQSVATESGTSLLKMLLAFTEFIQEGVPAFDVFLSKYLLTWNGVTYRPYILQLLTRMRLYPYRNLNAVVLDPLRRLFLSCSVYTKSQLLVSFTRLLHNLVTVEWGRYKKTLQAQNDAAVLSDNEEGSHSVFVGEVDSFRPLQTIYDFIEFVDKLSVLGLTLEDNHSLLMSCVLDFFHEVSLLHASHGVMFVYMPCSFLINKALMSSNAVDSSRMCQILCNLRNGYNSLKHSAIPSDVDITNSVDDRGYEQIQAFNSHILDYCNTLWRYKAFLSDHESSCSMDRQLISELQIPHENESLSINFHQAFIGFAWKFMKETQREGKKLHPSLIRQERKVAYLDYMKRENLHGIHEFISTFIKKPTK